MTIQYVYEYKLYRDQPARISVFTLKYNPGTKFALSMMWFNGDTICLTGLSREEVLDELKCRFRQFDMPKDKVETRKHYDRIAYALWGKVRVGNDKLTYEQWAYDARLYAESKKRLFA